MLQDTIEREIIVRAAKERVFDAIVNPEKIVAWFPNAIEGKLEAGERPIFDFGQDMKHQIFVVAIEPYEYFAYRWVPDSSKGFLGDVLAYPNTLVEFRLKEVPNGTLVMVKESGFASLPAQIAEQSFKGNSEGWEYMMGRLETLMAKG